MEFIAPQTRSLHPRAQHWLHLLQQASQPLSKKALFGKASNPADNALLAQLLAEGTLVNLACNQSFALVTHTDAQGRFAPLNLARQAVLTQLGLSLNPLVLTSSTLDKLKGIPPFVRPHLRQAVMSLVNEGQLIPIKHGRISLVIGLAGIEHQLAQVGVELVTRDSTPCTDDPARAELDPEALRKAYAQVLPAGGSMVEIGTLRSVLDCELVALHACLHELLAKQEVFLVRGEPTMLSPESIAAGLTVDGVTYYCVEICQD